MNHLRALSAELRKLANDLTETEPNVSNPVDRPDSERLRAAAVVIERMTCQHESDTRTVSAARVGRCRHCQTPMKLAWIVDEPEEDSEPES